MFISTDNLEDELYDDRDSVALEPAHQPPPVPSHLELVSVDNDVYASDELVDLDPGTPALPYAAE